MFSITDGNVLSTSKPESRYSWNNSTYYLPYNSFTLATGTTANNRVIAYQVTTTENGSSTEPTISGNDVLSATTTYNYSAAGAAYQPTYTNYRFNNANHYFDANGTSFTGAPADATIGAATWSISDNAYATVNATNGTVTVSSLPTSDIELTLTVSYPVTAGTGRPAAPAGITLTATKTITIQGTNPSAPIITVNGTSVTLATAAVGSTTIRYTLDGSDPTTSTGTVYNGSSFDLPLTASPVIIKAITVRNGNASSVTEQSVQLTLPAPVITADASAGTATISCANAGATIYYTTDGTTPSATNGTAYTSSLPGLPLMTTIKAIAVRDGWNDSPVTSTTLTLPSGVSGSTVTLFDYEPHSWSYYSDADCPIRSLNPADVKITYYGDGIMMMNNNNYTASSVENTDYITSSGNDYTGGAKVNVGGENENTFIYYKTLERGDATETAWTYSSSNQSSAASRCPYTPIPNPFQVRPTYGSRGTTDANSFTGWRGFQCWRLKSFSGGAVYSAASDGTALTVGAVINAETEIYFAPNAEYGMEVVLEAVWARAYLIKGNNSNENSVLPQNVGVERNFMTLTSNRQAYKFNGTTGRRITNLTYPVTISCYYPNGEAPDYTTSTVRGNDNNITLLADTKFENVGFYNMTSYTLSAAGHDLIIGRGCTGTVNIVRGMSNNTSDALDYTIRLESGVFNYVSFTAGYYDYNDGNNAANLTFSGTDNSVRGVMGCDYDRAVEESTANYNYTNAPLRVINNMILGATPSLSNQTEKEYFNATIKSGSYGTRGISTASAGRSFYFGMANTFNTGKRKVTIEGGQLNLSLAGGIDEGNTSDDAVTVRMKGGTVAGSVYGAAAFSSATGGRRFIFTGGTVGGWIAGGCNGTQTTGGKLEGKTFIYFGGTAQCNSNGSNTTIGPGNATGGNIFGAGSGNASATATATVGEVDQSTIVIADQSMVERNVYGGGNYGYVAGTGNTNKSDIYILGGDVRGSVFGGANMQKGNIVNITMKGGLVENGIYGGSNTRGNIAGNVTIQVDGGTVGQGNAGNGIFGGGYGQTTTVAGNVSVTLGTCTAGDATVYGDVYGGSALGTVNNATSDKTTVSLYNGTIRGGIYGGGYGPGGVAANVNGAVEVKVFGGSVLCSESDPQGEAGSGSVFGCNNAGGAPQSTVNVDIYKTDAAPGEGQYALHAVYGGGNKADYDGTPVVTIHGCNSSIEYVYGGGNASDVEGTNVTIWGGTIGNAFGGGNGYSVTGNHTNQSEAHYNPGANITTEGTNLKIYGGTIGAAFGGSNQYGTINDGVQVTVDSRDESNDGRPACVDSYTRCPLSIGELYSGGNEAALISSRSPLAYITPNKISVSLSCLANIGMLFGGAKAADYVGDINLVVDGGTYTKVFGGNNKGGT
ncbi:MAG: chitobiase/beta-hexosaminidase C-terminal domain-containing protein, partial [Bacteroidales bacterium]|nr:chitobiase/beta-hexosaminidase C-terminal domain-containing protein [Bacteroidales bacterium]